MKRIMLLMAVGAFMVSCDSRTYADISPVVTNPTYQANVKPVVDANCAGCHNQGGIYSPLTNYAEVRQAAQNGQFLCKINGSCGVMPPGGTLAHVTVDMINRWAQQGYAEN